MKNQNLNILLVALVVVALCSFGGKALPTLSDYQADSISCLNVAKFECEEFTLTYVDSSTCLVYADSSVVRLYYRYAYDQCREEWYLLETKTDE